MVEWNEINWRKLEKNVYKLQKRIFQASIRGDTKAIRRLRSINSCSSPILACRCWFIIVRC
ncbi:reverse transcriptase N-terminal domain-containing protein [Nostoc sp. C052]|uniref:reverse transcriptase N-terminal domain-containing protein n=1 Tax=Nostoc sp. C052 TaxID=2576902 RepID=UPI001C4DB1F6|nr:reverse transcriptase N-terminal domain-containing protein [Nostoc sp. C052]